MNKEVDIICWCNSGKKLKDCHFGHQEKQPIPFSEEQKSRKRIWNKTYCLHPIRSECNGGIIEAHTVQRARLKKISSDSHVHTPAFTKTPNNLEF